MSASRKRKTSKATTTVSSSAPLDIRETKLEDSWGGSFSADGVNLARLRRLARAGLEVDRCPVLGIELDIGPRAGRWQYPTTREGGIVSALAAAILESGVSPEALELAAAYLKKRGKQ